jgi:hypothetical protein
LKKSEKISDSSPEPLLHQAFYSSALLRAGRDIAFEPDISHKDTIKILFGYCKFIRILPCLADPQKTRVIAEAGDGRTVKNFETNRLKITEGVDLNE